jgi:hypothetical protein
MSEPVERRISGKLEKGFGPLLSAWESLLAKRIPRRVLACLIYVIAAAWWPCWLFHPQFLRFGFFETVCLDVMSVGPFAGTVVLVPLLASSARSGWADRAWVFVAAFCVLSVWVMYFASGAIAGRAGFYAD